jgi:hypothetical protein
VVVESRRVQVSSERGQSIAEIALAMAVMVGALALGIFVVVPMVRPEESTSRRDAYIRAVATQQARAYIKTVATQRAAGTVGDTPDAALAPVADLSGAPPPRSAAGGSDRREEVMFVGLFSVALVAMVGGAWFALTRGD